MDPIAFSPDSRLLVASSDALKTIAVFDLSTGHIRHEIKGNCEGALFSPDGKVLVIQDRDDDREDFWEVRPWRHLYRLESADTIAFSPDSKEVAFGTEDDTEIYRVSTGRPLRDLSGYWQAVFSPDGRWIAASASRTYDGAYILYQSHIDILDARSLRRIRRLSEWIEIEEMAFSSDSRRLAIVENDFQGDGYAIALWDMRTGKARQFCNVDEGMQIRVRSVRFLDQDRIIDITSDIGENYWDVKTGKQVDQVQQDGVTYFDFGLLSPNGVLMAAGNETTDTIQIFKVNEFTRGAGK